MARTREQVGHRLVPALVLGGLTLGIFLLFVLQFAIPYLLGPVGLVVVVALDAGIFLALRHRKAVRRRLREREMVAMGLSDRRLAARHRRTINDEIVVAIAFVVFVIGFTLQGVGLGADSWSPQANLGLILMGLAITGIAYMVMISYGWRWEFYGGAYDLRSESEKFDTTEDH